MRRLTLSLVGSVTLTLLALALAACGSATKTTANSSPTASSVVVSTLAGTAGTKGSADGTGATASFDVPIGLARDAHGNLYVVDSHNYTIRKITPAGVVTTLAGSAGAKGSADGKGAAARFNVPEGIACDAAGDLYVTDDENNTIRKITPAGVVTTLAGKAGAAGSTDGVGAAARFNAPVGIACGTDSNFYVADNSNFTIRKITRAGKVTTLAGKAGAAGSTDGKGAAARFNYPIGLTCDAAGDLYVAEYGNNDIRKITPAGVVTTLAGNAVAVAGSADGVGAAARFNVPAFLACDAAADLYVTDAGNCTIRKITPAGVVTTLAGKAGVEGSADGAGATARFFFPDGIARDAAGNLYVTDKYNNTIRKITLSH